MKSLKNLTNVKNNSKIIIIILLLIVILLTTVTLIFQKQNQTTLPEVVVNSPSGFKKSLETPIEYKKLPQTEYSQEETLLVNDQQIPPFKISAPPLNIDDKINSVQLQILPLKIEGLAKDLDLDEKVLENLYKATDHGSTLSFDKYSGYFTYSPAHTGHGDDLLDNKISDEKAIEISNQLIEKIGLYLEAMEVSEVIYLEEIGAHVEEVDSIEKATHILITYNLVINDLEFYSDFQQSSYFAQTTLTSKGDVSMIRFKPVILRPYAQTILETIPLETALKSNPSYLKYKYNNEAELINWRDILNFNITSYDLVYQLNPYNGIVYPVYKVTALADTRYNEISEIDFSVSAVLIDNQNN